MRRPQIKKCGEGPLTERKYEGLNAGVREFNLESPVFYLTPLPDKLIQTRLANLAGAIWVGVSTTIAAGHRSIQCHLKTNWLSVLRRT